MEGTLLKWTNYYNGWQPRYFILNEIGILSYYKSSELIHEGCKGSCLVDACDVKVHPHDPLRFDLIIPDEQFFCLKAKSQSERQHWLVALGSCKSRGTKSPTRAKTATASNDSASSLISHINPIDHELKLKVQELRLYEAVLLERIHAVKSITNNTSTPNVKELDKATSMLSVTCDAFVQSLSECVKLATDKSTQSSSFLLSSSSFTNSNSTSMNQQISNEFNSNTSTDKKTVLSKQIVYRTFFSKLRYTFAALSPLSFNEIHSDIFLFTCEQYFELIEKFNATKFNSFRSDVNNNINMLRERINTDQHKYQMLYSIIVDEMSKQMIKENNSATLAILWIKRSIHFLACFLDEFSQGDKSVESALNKAYRQTLKHSHDWIRRGIFSVALQSVPRNEDFLTLLAIDLEEAREVLFERQVLNEMLEHSTNMNIVVCKINDFYLQYHLELDGVVG